MPMCVRGTSTLNLDETLQRNCVCIGALQVLQSESYLLEGKQI